MTFRHLFVIVCLSIATLFARGASPVVAADKRDPAAEIGRLNSGLPAEQLKPDDWQVKERVLGAQRQFDFMPVVADAIIRIKDTFYVAPHDSRRWLVGRQIVDKSGPMHEIRCDQAFDDVDRLIRASRFADLPKPPDGFTPRVIATLPTNPSRLASDGRGEVLYALCVNGDVWRLDLVHDRQRQLLP